MKCQKRTRAGQRLGRDLGIEPLETRNLLAGDVLASLAGSNLKVDGDSLSNQVEIDQVGLAADEFRVSGMGGTTINGVAGPVVISGVTGNIDIDLDEGDNELSVDEVIAPGNVKIETGDGDDQVELDEVIVQGNLTIDTNDGFYLVNLRVAVDGNLKVSTDDGDSSTFFFFAGVNLIESFVAGNVEIKHKDGFDGGQIIDTVIQGNLKVDNGQGGEIDLGGGDTGLFGGFLGISGTAVDGNLQIKNKDGIDQTFLSGTTVGGNVKLDNGEGGSFLDGSVDESFIGGITQIAGLEVGGNLEIKNKEGFDLLQANQLSVGGNLKVDNGDGGTDQVVFGSANGSATQLNEVEVGGNLDFKSKDGTDLVFLDEVTVDGNAKIKTGDDDDEVRLVDSFFAKFSADGGKDDDLFEDAGGNVFLDGPNLKNFETIL